MFGVLRNGNTLVVITYNSFLSMLLRNFSDDVDLIWLQADGLVDRYVFA